MSEVISERARLFCSSAMERLEIERVVRQLEPTRAGSLVLFMDELLHTCMTWLNEYIVLQRRSMKPLTIYDLYCYVAILLMSHCTGISFQKTTDIMQRDGCKTPSLEEMRFISNHILAFSPTARGQDGSRTWLAQRDQTQRLTQFENTAFRVCCKIFFSPTHTPATLDEDLYGSRATDNQVKTFSNRKSDREGHAADTIADAIFRVTLMVRFRRRGVSQAENVSMLVQAILEGRGGQTLHGFIVTADGGYGKISLMRELLYLRIGSIMVMPEHLLQCHPFIGSSFLNVTRNDEEETSEESSGSGTDDASEEGMEIEHGNPSTSSNIASQQGDTSSLDRTCAFVINYGPDEGPASWWEVRNLTPTRRRRGATNPRSKVTAVAVREKGSAKFSKILCFMYCVPSTLSKSLEAWIAVPSKSALGQKLFSKRSDANRIVVPAIDSLDPKDVLERHLLSECTVLTINQRCADWFVLRLFCVTGTSAGKILCESGDVRGVLGMTERPERGERSLKEVLRSLCETWFSSIRSTEPMMRGTANGSTVLSSLSSLSFVKCIYECGMIGKKNETWLACSPDSIALIDTCVLDLSNENITGGELSIASVEIKTSVAQSSLSRALNLATADVVTCCVGDAKFRRYVPDQHVGQVIHQMVVLSVNFVIYVSAAEAGTIYTCVVYSSADNVEKCYKAFTDVVLATVSWAHEQDRQPPSFSDTTTRRALKPRLPFWLMVNNFVNEKGPFPPLKLFKHASQSLYSKTKSGVDGSAQSRAFLRSSTSSFKWEQKIVSQTIKTLTVNSFIAWRMTQKTAGKQSFVSGFELVSKLPEYCRVAC